MPLRPTPLGLMTLTLGRRICIVVNRFRRVDAVPVVIADVVVSSIVVAGNWIMNVHLTAARAVAAWLDLVVECIVRNESGSCVSACVTCQTSTINHD